MTNLFKQTLEVDALCLPEVDLSHGARGLAVRDLLGAVLAEHLVHLVGPLDDDPLYRVLEADVTVPAPGGPSLALLLVNVGRALYKGKLSPLCQILLIVPNEVILEGFDTRMDFQHVNYKIHLV